MKKKSKEKKPYKSMPSNVVWSFGRMLKSAPAALFIKIVSIPMNISLGYAGIYLPSFVVALVTENRGVKYAALSMIIFSAIVLLTKLSLTALSQVSSISIKNYNLDIKNKLNGKIMSCFYQSAEKKEIRDLFDRALNSTYMWNGSQPTIDLPTTGFSMIESLLSYMLYGTVISFVSPWLIPILTVTPAINYLSMKAYRKWEYNSRKKITNAQTKLDYVTALPSDYAYAKDIRIYGMIDWFKNTFRSLSGEVMGWEIKTANRQFLASLADLLVILLRDGAAYAILIKMTLDGEITPDKFVLYFAAISSFASQIGSIIGKWNSLHSMSLKICDLREFLDLDTEENVTSRLPESLAYPDYPAPAIEFENVTFCYDGAEEDTIKNISFRINPGEKIALVGLNGAGKTTIVKLMCGLYKPTSGRILINGTDTTTYSREDYCRLFSCVFQDIRTAFFTLAETISCTDIKETDLERVNDCVRRAGLEDKINSLPNGVLTKLDKQINKDATDLSGGQKQKLMLARALYKNAPVLILDEPTAALDPIAENEIYLSYNAMTEHKTSMFISHRLASTSFCDRIFYLSKGKITEEGSHDELMKQDGEYAALYEIQSCWYRDDYDGTYTEKENLEKLKSKEVE